MRHIGCALLLAIGLAACSAGGDHAAAPTSTRPASTSPASTTPTTTSAVEVHGSAAFEALTTGPIRNTRIKASDLHGRTVGTATTDTRGVFAMRLPPGEYNFTIAAGGGVAQCPTRAAVRRALGGDDVAIRCNGE